jgi:calcineurin-like phosphoesterase family protein
MKIILAKNQRLFFTSDTHYNHTNICRGISNWDGRRGTRDFNSLDEMNASIIDGINSTVGEDDVLVHLGDWSFGGFDSISEFREKINCKNVILFLGNHDHHIRRNKEEIQKIFANVTDYDVLDVRVPEGKETKKYQFVCSHYPIASWDGMGKGVPHLHGHVHLPPHLRLHEGKAMDVGMDGNNLIPHLMEDILEMLSGRPNKYLVLPKDHHTEI